VKCDKCNCEISAVDSYQYLGKTLCEDCYIDIKYPAKVCDPWAVYTATRSRQQKGLKDTEGLTELQGAIYGYIRSSGKVTREKLMNNFNLGGVRSADSIGYITAL